MTLEHELSMRLTKYFVGSFRYLDDWKRIGSYDRLASYPLNVETNSYGEMSNAWFIEIEPIENVSESDMHKALDSEFTMQGCACERDCCGCRSYDCAELHPMDNNHVVVVVESSCNF